ncbi:hypothetical protein KCU95_g2071, partial [Aureobasidium melanogenum]
MSISTQKLILYGFIYKPCLKTTEERPWKKFKEDLQAAQNRFDTVLDAQARGMDLMNFTNHMIAEMEKFAKSVHDQSFDEIKEAISASLFIADKVIGNVSKDIKKIAKLVNDVKRDQKVAKTLKNLDAGMLDVATPILSLPRSNVFRETMIRGSLPKFDKMKDVLSAKVKEAQRSATCKKRAKSGHSCRLMTVEKTRRVVVVRSVDTLLYEYRCIFMTTNYLLQVGQAVHDFKD